MARIDKIVNANSSWSITKSVNNTDGDLTNVKLEVFIYSGVQGDSDPQGSSLGASGGRTNFPTYILNSTPTLATGTKESSFEISTLVRDYIESELNGSYNSDNAIWIDIQMTDTIDAVDTIRASEHYLALDGYDYTRDNSINNSILVSNTKILRLDGQSVSIPTLGQRVKSYEFEKDGVVTSSGVGINSTSSNEQIQYITDSSDADKLTIVSYPELNDLNLAFNSTYADWRILSGDTIVGEKLTFGGATGGRYPEAFRGTVGQTYVVSFRVTEVTSGSLSGVYDGSGGINLTGVIDEVGDYSVTYTQTDTSNNLLSLYTSTGFTGVMENISLREVDNLLDSTNILSNWFIQPSVTVTDLGSGVYRMTTSASGLVTETLNGEKEGDEITASATLSGTGIALLRIQEDGDNYTTYKENTITLTSTPTKYSVTAINQFDGNGVLMTISLTNSASIVDIRLASASISNTTQVIEIDNVEECRYDSKKLTFVNKFGAFQDVWMFANSKTSLNVKSDTWNRRNLITGGGSFRPTTVKTTTSVNEKITLNSGFYPESNNVVFEELMQSNSVWLWEGSNTYPVIVKDSSFDFKDSNTDKLINYTLSIEYASNKMMTL